jgi:hypothetical protein
VTVYVHGGVEGYLGGVGPFFVDLPSGATLLELQDLLGVPRGEVGLFLVDGELRSEGEAPDAGARVDLYPLFGGG